MANFDFIRLSFDGVSTADLNLFVVSNSGRYTAPLSPLFENRTTSVPGRPGLLYWGTEIINQEFSVSLATDSMTGQQLNLFKKTFQPGKIGKLVFEETKHKYYYAMISSPPELSFVPFQDKNTRIYKGEVSLTFTSLSPHSYSDDALWDSQVHGAQSNQGESGLPTLEDFPATGDTIYFLSNGKRIRNRLDYSAPVNGASTFVAYNAGNAPANVDLSFTVNLTVTPHSEVSEPLVNWYNINIKDSLLIKPRFIRDIDFVFKNVFAQYSTGAWETEKQQTLKVLREELNGTHRNKLIGLVDLMGSGLAYPNFDQLYYAIIQHFFTNVPYTFQINASTNQSILTVTSGAEVYIEDNTGAFNGKFIYLAPSGVLPVIEGSETFTSSVQLDDVELQFLYTYI